MLLNVEHIIGVFETLSHTNCSRSVDHWTPCQAMWQWTVSKFSSIQIFHKTGKGKKKNQHVFFLLNKLLGAELYRVINNNMVNVGTGEPMNKLVCSELAVAKLMLFWEHKNIFEFILNSSYGGECRSQKERWKVKTVSLILSRAPWACVWVWLGSDTTKCNVFLPSSRSMLRKGRAAVYSASALEEMAQGETLDQQGKRWFWLQ